MLRLVSMRQFRNSLVEGGGQRCGLEVLVGQGLGGREAPGRVVFKELVDQV